MSDSPAIPRGESPGVAATLTEGTAPKHVLANARNQFAIACKIGTQGKESLTTLQP